LRGPEFEFALLGGTGEVQRRLRVFGSVMRASLWL